MIDRPFTRAIAVGVSVVSLALAAVPAAAQQPAIGAQCELHIWPSENLTVEGFDYETIRSRNSLQLQRQFARIAGLERQLAAIRSANPVAKLGLPKSTQIIEHSDIEDHKHIERRDGRRASSPASCYYELHVLSYELYDGAMWGDSFTTNFDFRAYSTAASWDVRFVSRGADKLKGLPIEPDDDPALVKANVWKVLTANFIEFAKKAKGKMASESR